MYKLLVSFIVSLWKEHKQDNLIKFCFRAKVVYYIKIDIIYFIYIVNI